MTTGATQSNSASVYIYPAPEAQTPLEDLVAKLAEVKDRLQQGRRFSVQIRQYPGELIFTVTPTRDPSADPWLLATRLKRHIEKVPSINVTLVRRPRVPNQPASKRKAPAERTIPPKPRQSIHTSRPTKLPDTTAAVTVGQSILSLQDPFTCKEIVAGTVVLEDKISRATCYVHVQAYIAEGWLIERGGVCDGRRGGVEIRYQFSSNGRKQLEAHLDRIQTKGPAAKPHPVGQGQSRLSHHAAGIARALLNSTRRRSLTDLISGTKISPSSASSQLIKWEQAGWVSHTQPVGNRAYLYTLTPIGRSELTAALKHYDEHPDTDEAILRLMRQHPSQAFSISDFVTALARIPTTIDTAVAKLMSAGEIVKTGSSRSRHNAPQAIYRLKVAE